MILGGWFRPLVFISVIYLIVAVIVVATKYPTTYVPLPAEKAYEKMHDLQVIDLFLAKNEAAKKKALKPYGLIEEYSVKISEARVAEIAKAYHQRQQQSVISGQKAFFQNLTLLWILPVFTILIFWIIVRLWPMRTQYLPGFLKKAGLTVFGGLVFVLSITQIYSMVLVNTDIYSLVSFFQSAVLIFIGGLLPTVFLLLVGFTALGRAWAERLLMIFSAIWTLLMLVEIEKFHGRLRSLVDAIEPITYKIAIPLIVTWGAVWIVKAILEARTSKGDQ